MCAYIYKPKRKRTSPTVGKRKEVYNTTLWRRMRLAHLTEHPLCAVCELMGKTTLASQVHHRKSFLDARDKYEMESLAFDSNNLISVCPNCHSRFHSGDLIGCITDSAIYNKLKELNLLCLDKIKEIDDDRE